MALVNYATREINAKIVYYGPGLSGKTTNIQHVFQKVKPKNKGKLISLSTQGDRTLFFDFLPVELGTIKGFRTRFHLYTVPGQVFYNSTRKLVLKGADGVVFVADSQKMMMDENIQSLENLRNNLTEMGINLDEFPIVIQYNKRDLPNAAAMDEMERYLNPKGLPYFEASAIKGDGVLMTLTAIVKFILHDLRQDPATHNIDFAAFEEGADTGPLPDEAAREAAPGPVSEPVALPARATSENAGLEPVPEKARKAPDDTLTDINILKPVIPAEEPEMAAETAPEAPPAPPEPEFPTVMVADIGEAEEAREPEHAEEKTPVAGPEPEAEAEESGFSTEEMALFAEIAGTKKPASAGEVPAAVQVVEAALLEKPGAKAARSEALPGQTFILPVRITTFDGMREVTLKVSVDVTLEGEGVEAVSRVEVLQPRPKEPPSPPVKPTEQERPRQPYMPVPKPKVSEKKVSMFQKILGMK